MKRHSTATLMGMTKKELVEYVRVVEHNESVAWETLHQQAENVKDWEPVNPELKKVVKRLHENYAKAKSLAFVYNPIGWALYHTWKRYDD